MSLQELSADQWDAIVIGAGPAGSATAIQLARRGLRTLLVEKRAFPRFKVCGCCLNRRSLAMLDAVGLRDGIAALGGTELSSVRIHYRGRMASLPIPGGMAVSRAAMDQTLVDAAIAAGVCWLPETTASVEPTVEDDQRHVSLRSADGSRRDISANVVIVADGLGHPSLSRLDQFVDVVKDDSRIGIGASVGDQDAFDDAAVSAGQIQMIVGRGGYVGLVRSESRHVQLAAAVDGSMLAGERTPIDAVTTIMQEAGVDVPTALRSTNLKGTLPLTRSVSRVADERLFVLGDATGYVEPFTGEGMAWALSSSVALAPIAERAAHGWSPKFAEDWTLTHHRLVRRRQKNCHRIARLLRSTWLLALVMPVLQCLPWTANRVIQEMNDTPPELLKS